MTNTKIDITTLNDQELDIILSASVPALRSIYEKSGELKKTINGFRASTISPNMLIPRAKKSIQNDKNAYLTKNLNSLFEGLQKDIDGTKTELVGEGQSEDDALMTAIKKEKLSPDMVPVFLKMIGANTEIVEKEKERDAIRSFIKDEVARQSPKVTPEKPVVDKDKGQSKRIESLSKRIQSLSDQISSLENNQRIEEKQYGDLKEEIKSLNEQFDKLSAQFDKLSLSLKKPQKTAVQLKQVQEAPTKEFEKLRSKIEKLESGQETLLGASNSVSSIGARLKQSIFVEETPAYDYFRESDGEYFSQNIEDIAEDFVGGKSIEAFCGFLTECFYSEKLIFASRKNASPLAVALASIIAGGRLVHLSADTNFTNRDLLEAIKGNMAKDGNTVFLIDGVLGNFDIQISISGIKKDFMGQGIFVFSVPDERSVKFLPGEIMEDFLFFSGTIKNTKPQYRYLGALPNKKKFGNDGLKSFLSNVGLVLSYIEIAETDDVSSTNDVISGLICFSYLPFICLHDGKDKDDVLGKIQNPTLKSTCEGILR